MLFLHGYPQSRHTWRQELKTLSGLGYRVCAPDQRGYSPGARPLGVESYRTELIVQDAIDIASALGAERFHLVGHDWGGGVAWCLASLHPENVATLSVISRPHPAAFAKALENDPEQSERSEHHVRFLKAEVTNELISDNLQASRKRLGAAGIPKSAVDAYLSGLSSFDAMDAALNWYRAAPESSIQGNAMSPVVMPTLYVWGTADGTVGRYAAEETAKWVDAPYQFVEIQDVGHFVTDQVPEKFTKLLVDHLEKYGGELDEV